MCVIAESLQPLHPRSRSELGSLRALVAASQRNLHIGVGGSGSALGNASFSPHSPTDAARSSVRSFGGASGSNAVVINPHKRVVIKGGAAFASVGASSASASATANSGLTATPNSGVKKVIRPRAVSIQDEADAAAAAAYSSSSSSSSASYELSSRASGPNQSMTTAAGGGGAAPAATGQEAGQCTVM